ncbi:MAG: SusC/RagA family TonB-linked outer membrane protein [Marinifilaceae bacterium]
MRKITGLFVFLICIGVQIATAQTKQITGTVTSAEDGLGIPGVSVVVKGTTMGASTNIDGFYSLQAKSTDVLVFSFVGMEQQEIVVGDKTTIDVVLNSTSIGVDEVMVVAYGTAKKESFTGSVQMVDSEKLEKRTVSSISKALEGTVAGVQTTSGGGQPGAGASIRIRGFGSINASSSPLYVVDGIPYDGNINALNPDDIASVSVLKDASASALYGARGANGVVIITTKRGGEKEPEIRFKAVYGVASRATEEYETVNPKEYMELAYEAYKNQLIYSDGYSADEAAILALQGGAGVPSYMEMYGGEKYNLFSIASDKLIDPATGKMVANAEYKYRPDWFDEATRDNPLRSDYQLSVTGGNEKTQYMFSAGYLEDKGLVEKSSFKRYSGRMNLDSQLKEWVKAGMSTSYSMTEQNYLTDSGTSYNNIWYSALGIAPIYPVYERDAKGNFILDANGKKQFDYGKDRPYASNFNSIATLFDDSRDVRYDNLSGRTYMEFDTDNEDVGFLKDLKLSVNFGFDYRHGDKLIYNNPYHGDAGNVGGRGYKYSYRLLSYTFNQLLNYSKKIGDHSFDVLVGHEYYDKESSTFYGSKQGYVFGGLTELDAAAVPTGVGSYVETYRVESFLSRLNYSFADKYYFSGSYRKDGSSRFNEDYRWGDFWSVGGSWRVSQEDFLQSVEWLNNLTLKASYGSQGNDMLLSGDDPNYYAWQSFYSLQWPNNNMGGVWLTSLENKEVEWEKNKNMNIGLEGRLFDRVSLSVDYFHKKTTDLLLYRPKSTSTGFNGYWDNIGDMVNKGVDIELSADIFKGDFNWNFTTQWSLLRNEVTKLTTEGQEIVDGSFIVTKGKPINSFYLPKSAGVDPLTGKQLYYVKDDEGNRTVTDSYNEAANNKVIMGSRIPDFYGSVSNTFSYKGFDLSVLLTYSVGGEVLDYVYSGLLSTRDPGGNLHKAKLRRWQKPGDVTDVPRLELGSVNRMTDNQLMDASYLSIKNVSLGYSFPSSMTAKMGLKQLRIFLTGDNLAVFSKLKGMDPQYNFSGSQNYSYVPVKVVSLGVDVKF